MLSGQSKGGHAVYGEALSLSLSLSLSSFCRHFVVICRLSSVVRSRRRRRRRRRRIANCPPPPPPGIGSCGWMDDVDIHVGDYLVLTDWVLPPLALPSSLLLLRY